MLHCCQDAEFHKRTLFYPAVWYIILFPQMALKDSRRNPQHIIGQNASNQHENAFSKKMPRLKKSS